MPKAIMHKVPATLLHSFAGIRGGDWENLLKLQSKDGFFLFFPSSTAYALLQTKQSEGLMEECAVLNVYPVNLFENIWAVDHLQRLGTPYIFETEIIECVNYIHRYWAKEGVCWDRNSEFQDIDDTAMGIRELSSRKVGATSLNSRSSRKLVKTFPEGNQLEKNEDLTYKGFCFNTFVERFTWWKCKTENYM